MAKELSPKKYIETQCRKLPIYKCYINRDWDTARMANVFILRKHTNGNITIGIYLVDLACLGIKDTFFFFNLPESDINERLDLPNMFLKEVDYTLAHNIVFAGHDYALDYDINPHKDFATTKFILEEDDDKISLIDIPVGGDDGKPLLVLQPGQSTKYKHVYDKLVKNLGKDNFNFVMGADMLSNYEEAENMDMEEEEFNEEDEDSLTYIDDFEMGQITRSIAKEIDISDLVNSNKINSRSQIEVLILEIESIIRLLQIKRKDLFYSEEEIEYKSEYTLYTQAKMYPNWITDEMMMEANQMMDDDIAFIADMENKNNSKEALIKYDNDRTIDNINSYSHNPYALMMLYEKSILSKHTEGINLLYPVIIKLAKKYETINLELALCTYYLNEDDTEFAEIIQVDKLQNLFKHTNEISDLDLNIYGMFKLLFCIRKSNLKEAIYYYNLLSDIDMGTPMMVFIELQFREFISQPFNEAYKQLLTDDKMN